MTEHEFIEELASLMRYGRRVGRATGRHDIEPDIDSLVGWVALRERQRYRPGMGLRFRTFARISVKTEVRRLAARRSRPLEEAPAQWEPPAPGAALAARELLESLTPDERELLWLRFHQGEQVQALARRYGKHRSIITRRIARLRKALIECDRRK